MPNAAKVPSRSIGVKLIIVGALALVMGIPALFVDSLIDERTHRAEEVAREVGATVGGRQIFLGPVLAVPYIVTTPDKRFSRGVYVISPARADATITTKNEVRHRSLFKVPVYQSDLKLAASFDLTGVTASAPNNATLEWNKAEFLVSASDPRGALSDATLTVDGKTETFVPATVLDTIASDPDKHQDALNFFGVPAANVAKPDTKFEVSASMAFSGAQRLAVLAYGKTTTVSVRSDWPNPSFDGGFLPVKRTISAQGFSAQWSVPFIARGVRSEGDTELLARLRNTAMGVSFVELADPYQSVTRSVKYVLLFVSLVFLTYFLFETKTGKRVHPAQYLLVGMAQIVFYLLLLSIAERTGFDIAFAIAGTATVGLISSYAGYVFDSRAHGIRALVVFSALYTLIYVLMRLEDQALIVGAIASFVAIATVMYLTRGIDWYDALPGRFASPKVEDTGPEFEG